MDPTKSYWRKKYLRNISTCIFDYAKGQKYEICKIYHTQNTQTKYFSYLAEHILGRQKAAELIINYLKIKYNKDTIDNLTIEETKTLLLKYALIVNIQKFKNFGTLVNKDLEKYQKGNITFEQYNEILIKHGYNALPESVRPYFDKN